MEAHTHTDPDADANGTKTAVASIEEKASPSSPPSGEVEAGQQGPTAEGDDQVRAVHGIKVCSSAAAAAVTPPAARPADARQQTHTLFFCARASTVATVDC